MRAAHSGAAFLQIAVACTPQILQITAQYLPLFVKSAFSSPLRIHKTLPTTPAMAANITKRLWEIGDIVDVLESWAASQVAA
jgi:hypothetical protein